MYIIQYFKIKIKGFIFLIVLRVIFVALFLIVNQMTKNSTLFVV